MWPHQTGRARSYWDKTVGAYSWEWDGGRWSPQHTLCYSSSFSAHQTDLLQCKQCWSFVTETGLLTEIELGPCNVRSKVLNQSATAFAVVSATVRLLECCLQCGHVPVGSIAWHSLWSKERSNDSFCVSGRWWRNETPSETLSMSQGSCISI
jgi:hypothetical protein